MLGTRITSKSFVFGWQLKTRLQCSVVSTEKPAQYLRTVGEEEYHDYFFGKGTATQLGLIGINWTDHVRFWKKCGKN